MSGTPPPVDPYLSGNRDDQPDERERRSGFQFGFDTSGWRHWGLFAGGVFIVIGLGLRVVGTLIEALDDPERSTQGVGSIMGSIVCVGIGPAVLVAIARSVRGTGTRRTMMTAAAALAILLGVLQIAAGGATIYTAQRSRANARAREADARLQAARLEIAEKSRNGTATAADLQKLKDATDRVADTLTGKDKALGDSLRDFVAHVTEIAQPVALVNQEFGRLGGLKPESLSDESTVRQRIKLLRDNQETVEKAARLARALPAKIREIAAAHGVRENDTEVMLRKALGNGQHEKLVRIREIDTELYPTMAEYLSLAADNRDKWEVVQGNIQGTDGDFLARFNAQAARIQMLSKEQTDLSAQLSRPNPRTR